MAPPPSQKTMTTQATNSKHPAVDVGTVAPKKKHQTVVEVQWNKEDKAAQAAIIEKVRKDKVYIRKTEISLMSYCVLIALKPKFSLILT